VIAAASETICAASLKIAEDWMDTAKWNSYGDPLFHSYNFETYSLWVEN